MQELIEVILTHNWLLDQNRTSQLEFYQLHGNALWTLRYTRGAREWTLCRDGKVVYRGVDGNPEDIVSRLPDITTVIYNYNGKS